MGLETVTYISDLVTTNPESADLRSQGDDHLRNIKTGLRNSLPNADRAQYFQRVSASKTADFSIVAVDMEKIFPVDCTADHVDVALPALAAGNDGWAVKLVKTDATANTIRIAGTINGDTDGFTVSRQWQMVILMWTGAEWIALHPLNMVDDVPTFANIVVTGLMTMSSTGYMLPPRGTSAQRPGSDLPGALRYNTDLGIIEWQDNDDQFRQPSIAPPYAAGFKHLIVINNSGTPNTIIDLDADEVVVVDSNGIAYLLRNVNLSIDAGSTGVNGLDAGGLANNEWYAGLVIYNPATGDVGGLLVDKDNFPSGITLPSGYDAWARFSWHRTNGSAQFHRVRQHGRDAQYVVSASVTTAMRQMASGAAGTPGTPTWSAIDVTPYVPPTASTLKGTLYANNSVGIAAPNNSYGAHTSLSNPPAVVNNTSAVANIPFEFILESTNIYWASSTGNDKIYCSGWRDNI